MTGLEPKTVDASLEDLNRPIRELRSRLDPLFLEIGKVIIGQKELIDRLLIGLLTGGHLLLEGMPGLAKTLAVSTIAKCLDLTFQRIQFTPDLLPADVVGTQIYNPRTGEFTVKKGPIFANLVLADEINRAPAKVQSALLEAMQEKQITIGDTSFRLQEPFLVLATQNPIEQEGTYTLPEAQIDRFMMKLQIPYPTKEEELAILNRMAKVDLHLQPQSVLNKETLFDLRTGLDQVYLDDRLKDYVVQLVQATRKPKEYGLDIEVFFEHGASPRATIALALAAKASAFLDGRGFVLPDDIKKIAADVLRHRIAISYEAEAEDLTSDVLVKKILDHIAVP